MKTTSYLAIASLGLVFAFHVSAEEHNSGTPRRINQYTTGAKTTQAKSGAMEQTSLYENNSTPLKIFALNGDGSRGAQINPAEAQSGQRVAIETKEGVFVSGTIDLAAGNRLMANATVQAESGGYLPAQQVHPGVQGVGIMLDKETKGKELGMAAGIKNTRYASTSDKQSGGEMSEQSLKLVVVQKEAGGGYKKGSNLLAGGGQGGGQGMQ